MRGFVLLDKIEQFEEEGRLNEGDCIVVQWDKFTCRHKEDCHRIEFYRIVEIRRRKHTTEVICRVKGNHFFNYKRYLDGTSGAEQVYLAVGVPKEEEDE